MQIGCGLGGNNLEQGGPSQKQAMSPISPKRKGVGIMVPVIFSPSPTGVVRSRVNRKEEKEIEGNEKKRKSKNQLSIADWKGDAVPVMKKGENKKTGLASSFSPPRRGGNGDRKEGR